MARWRFVSRPHRTTRRHEDTNPIARQQRHGMQLAWWTRDGYQYALIGRNLSAQLASTAET